MGIHGGPLRARSIRVRGRTASIAVALAAAVALITAPGAARAGTDSGLAGSAVPTVAAAPSPGTYTGLGFDARCAPTSATMQAWLSSPYRAVGIYFGGVNRSCTPAEQPHLTADWVSIQQAAGWHLLPIYVGLQAPCTTSNKKYLIDPAQAAAQGRSSAEDAIVQATTLGLVPGSILTLDMEAYRTGDTACSSAVQSYVGQWTARLHEAGYYSGFYSSLSSGVADQVAMYPTVTYPHPDYLDFARWDGVVSTSDPSIPSTYWPGARRMKQYQGGHDETWGGVTINIDNDYVDFGPLTATPFGDFTGNGWSDVLGRHSSTGLLYSWAGNGTTVGGPVQIGTGWSGMSAIVRYGDFNRDGHEDVIAREAATGYLWLYPWTGTGFGTRIRLGTNWNGVREITAAGDLNRDGYPDLLGVRTATGQLYYWAGTGTGLGSWAILGTGWNTMDELTGVGDFNRDGYADLVARDTLTGNIYLYPGRGVGFASRIQIGTGWGTMRSLTGIGDFDRDGYTDLFAVDNATGTLYWYRGLGTSLAPRISFGSNWGPLTTLL